MNSPTIPGQKIIGKKAAKVVLVPAIIGPATSPVPFFADSKLSYPSSRYLNIFSTTTIALSTNIPRANINENKTIMFMVMPSALRMMNDKNIERGMDIPTKDAFRTPKKNNNTPITRISPEIILFSKLLTIFFTSLL